MKKVLSVLCVFILSFALVSCSGEPKDTSNEDIVNPIDVSISFSDSENDDVEAADFEAIEETEFTVTIDSAGGYITGMLGLNEGDYADTTGWIYTINGESVSVGADEQILQEGDKIAWEFVDFSTYTW